MSRYDFISTVYISSSEARTLIRTSEQGVSKFCLVRMSEAEIRDFAAVVKMKEADFVDAYLIDKTPNYGVGIFQVNYRHNEHSTPPTDGKVRDLNPDYQWLKVDLQLLIPPPANGDVRPIPYSRIYTDVAKSPIATISDRMPLL
jgi:hypothetical protein